MTNLIEDTKIIPRGQEGLQALSSSGGLVGDSGSLRGNTKLAGQGLGPLSLPGALGQWPGERSGNGLDAPGVAGGSLGLVGQGITQQESRSIPTCTNAGWLRGGCQHGTVRWVRLRCKRRDCRICGEERRRMIAWRISRGIDILGGSDGGAWFVGTFAWHIPKDAAVKVQGKFIRWLRHELGYKVEYAATWELQPSGRLHLNLVLAPWRYVPKEVLDAAWQRFGGGPRTWIERVGAGIGVEAAKAREGIGGYLGKWEQMVENGRGVAYSKGWPKLPDNPCAERRGEISWQWVGELSQESAIFWYEREMGYWQEVSPGEYGFVAGENCGCFERSPPRGVDILGHKD